MNGCCRYPKRVTVQPSPSHQSSEIATTEPVRTLSGNTFTGKRGGGPRGTAKVGRPRAQSFVF